MLVVAVRTFVALSPPEVVREHLQELSSLSVRYRIVDEAEEPAKAQGDPEGRRVLEPATRETEEIEDRG